MEKFVIFVLLFFTLIQTINSIDSNSDTTVLSRRRRYVVFPEGSTISVAICLTTSTLHSDPIFIQATNWGISYELPNDTSDFKQFYRPKHVMQRRHRRDLYQKMEVIMNNMGYDGRSCIFKALCETSRKLIPQADGIVEELLRIIFRFPQQRLQDSEPEEHRLYHWAHRIGRDSDIDCSQLFPGCAFSLIDMALGSYSNALSGEGLENT